MLKMFVWYKKNCTGICFSLITHLFKLRLTCEHLTCVSVAFGSFNVNLIKYMPVHSVLQF